MAWVLIGWLVFHTSSCGDFYSQYCTQTNTGTHPTSTIQSEVMTPWCYYLRSFIRSTVWNLMKHKDEFTFIYCKTRWHYIPHLTAECTCHNQWIHTNIWNRNNHIISKNWCPCIKTFPPFDSTESRRHKLCQKDPACHQNDTCSGLIHFVHCHHTVKKKRTFNDTIVSSGIIKKGKKAKENTLPVFYV